MSQQPSEKKEQKRKTVPSDLPVVLRIVKSRLFQVMATLLALYTLGGFFLAPYLVERYLPRVLQKNLVCEARLGEVRINPYLFTFEVNDFRMFDLDGTLVSRFDRLFLDLELSGLFRWAWTFKAFQLENPEVSIVFEPDGIVNLTKLIPENISDNQAPAPGKTDAEDKAPLRMVVQNIEFMNGVIHIADLRQSDPATADIMPLNISLERVSTLPEHKGPYSLKANLADGGTLSWIGTISYLTVSCPGGHVGGRHGRSGYHRL